VHDELADEHPQQIIQLSRTRHRRERLLGFIQRLLNGRGKLFCVVICGVGQGFQDALEFLPAGLQLGALPVDQFLGGGAELVIHHPLDQLGGILVDGRDLGTDPLGILPASCRPVSGDLDRVFDERFAAGQDRHQRLDHRRQQRVFPDAS